MAKKSSKKNVASANGTATNGSSTAVSDALAQLAALKVTLAKVGLVSLTPTQRKDSNGKLRVGEDKAMVNVLDVIDAFPRLFESLADKDGGTDPALVETAPARDHVALWTALAPIAAEIDAIQSSVSDTLLASAEAAKEVTVPGYGILRANASSNAALAKKGAPAITFYGHPAKQRAANVASAARKATKPKAKSVSASN